MRAELALQHQRHLVEVVARGRIVATGGTSRIGRSKARWRQFVDDVQPGVADVHAALRKQPVQERTRGVVLARVDLEAGNDEGAVMAPLQRQFRFIDADGPHGRRAAPQGRPGKHHVDPGQGEQGLPRLAVDAQFAQAQAGIEALPAALDAADMDARVQRPAAGGFDQGNGVGCTRQQEVAR